MKFVQSLAIATLIGYTTAVDLFLWPKEDACGGKGIACPGIPEHTCCLEEGKLWGSGSSKLSGTTGDNKFALFTKRGNLYCGVQLGQAKKIPNCIVSGQLQSVGGSAWEKITAKRVRREVDMADNAQLRPCESSVRGHPVYSDGVKYYMITNEKMAREGLTQPTDQSKVEEFFKKHADRVMHVEGDSSWEEVGSAHTTTEDKK